MSTPAPSPGSAAHVPGIVLVTGSGRSGTSSLAGSLQRLGLHVPQPEVPPSPSNPRGFYEPQWVIDFHKLRLRELGLHNIDSRPWAVDLVRDQAAGARTREELTAWLAEQLGSASTPGDLVIKDPHAFWFLDVWKQVAVDIGSHLRVLTAVRHPAEVVGSRDLAYLQRQPIELRRVKETSNVAGWLHAALVTEQGGRDVRRAFIGYADLVSDWRSALGRVDRQLGLGTADQLDPGMAHPIDDFLDAGLQRSKLTWDDLHLPDSLRTMAQETWVLLARLIQDPHEGEVLGRLDEIHAEYVVRYREATELVYDHTRGEIGSATRQAEDQISRLRRRVRRLRAAREVATPEPPAGPPVPPDETEGIGQRLRTGLARRPRG